MPKRNGNNNKDKFAFTKDLNLIKPYTNYDLSIENYLSRFKPNDIILHNKNIGFALSFHRHFCPINIINDPYCLDYIYVKENYRGKGHARRLMNLILKHFQIIIHILDDSLGFFKHLSKDLKLEKIFTNMPFGASFISTNLNINRKPIVNTCLGGCGLLYSGNKRYICSDCHIKFARYNIDFKLIELNKALRSKLNVIQPSVIFSNTEKSLLEILENNNDIVYQRSNLEKMYMMMRMLTYQ